VVSGVTLLTTTHTYRNTHTSICIGVVMIIGLVVYRLTLQPVGNIHGGAKKWRHKLTTIILSNLNRGRLKMHDLKM